MEREPLQESQHKILRFSDDEVLEHIAEELATKESSEPFLTPIFEYYCGILDPTNTETMSLRGWTLLLDAMDITPDPASKNIGSVIFIETVSDRSIGATPESSLHFPTFLLALARLGVSVLLRPDAEKRLRSSKARAMVPPQWTLPDVDQAVAVLLEALRSARQVPQPEPAAALLTPAVVSTVKARQGMLQRIFFHSCDRTSWTIAWPALIQSLRDFRVFPGLLSKAKLFSLYRAVTPQMAPLTYPGYLEYVLRLADAAYGRPGLCETYETPGDRLSALLSKMQVAPALAELEAADKARGTQASSRIPAAALVGLAGGHKRANISNIAPDEDDLQARLIEVVAKRIRGPSKSAAYEQAMSVTQSMDGASVCSSGFVPSRHASNSPREDKPASRGAGGKLHVLEQLDTSDHLDDDSGSDHDEVRTLYSVSAGAGGSKPIGVGAGPRRATWTSIPRAGAVESTGTAMHSPFPPASPTSRLSRESSVVMEPASPPGSHQGTARGLPLDRADLGHSLSVPRQSEPAEHALPKPRRSQSLPPKVTTPRQKHAPAMAALEALSFSSPRTVLISTTPGASPASDHAGHGDDAGSVVRSVAASRMGRSVVSSRSRLSSSTKHSIGKSAGVRAVASTSWTKTYRVSAAGSSHTESAASAMPASSPAAAISGNAATAARTLVNMGARSSSLHVKSRPAWATLWAPPSASERFAESQRRKAAALANSAEAAERESRAMSVGRSTTRGKPRRTSLGRSAGGGPGASMASKPKSPELPRQLRPEVDSNVLAELWQDCNDMRAAVRPVFFFYARLRNAANQGLMPFDSFLALCRDIELFDDYVSVNAVELQMRACVAAREQALATEKPASQHTESLSLSRRVRRAMTARNQERRLLSTVRATGGGQQEESKAGDKQQGGDAQLQAAPLVAVAVDDLLDELPAATAKAAYHAELSKMRSLPIRHLDEAAFFDCLLRVSELARRELHQVAQATKKGTQVHGAAAEGATKSLKRANSMSAASVERGLAGADTATVDQYAELDVAMSDVADAVAHARTFIERRVHPLTVLSDADVSTLTQLDSPAVAAVVAEHADLLVMMFSYYAQQHSTYTALPGPAAADNRLWTHLLSSERRQSALLAVRTVLYGQAWLQLGRDCDLVPRLVPATQWVAAFYMAARRAGTDAASLDAQAGDAAGDPALNPNASRVEADGSFLPFAAFIEAVGFIALQAFSRDFLAKQFPSPADKLLGLIAWVRASGGVHALAVAEWSAGHGKTGRRLPAGSLSKHDRLQGAALPLHSPTLALAAAGIDTASMLPDQSGVSLEDTLRPAGERLAESAAVLNAHAQRSLGVSAHWWRPSSRCSSPSRAQRALLPGSTLRRHSSMRRSSSAPPERGVVSDNTRLYKEIPVDRERRERMSRTEALVAEQLAARAEWRLSPPPQHTAVRRWWLDVQLGPGESSAADLFASVNSSEVRNELATLSPAAFDRARSPGSRQQVGNMVDAATPRRSPSASPSLGSTLGSQATLARSGVLSPYTGPGSARLVAARGTGISSTTMSPGELRFRARMSAAHDERAVQAYPRAWKSGQQQSDVSLRAARPPADSTAAATSARGALPPHLPRSTLVVDPAVSGLGQVNYAIHGGDALSPVAQTYHVHGVLPAEEVTAALESASGQRTARRSSSVPRRRSSPASGPAEQHTPVRALHMAPSSALEMLQAEFHQL